MSDGNELAAKTCNRQKEKNTFIKTMKFHMANDLTTTDLSWDDTAQLALDRNQ